MGLEAQFCCFTVLNILERQGLNVMNPIKNYCKSIQAVDRFGTCLSLATFVQRNGLNIEQRISSQKPDFKKLKDKNLKCMKSESVLLRFDFTQKCVFCESTGFNKRLTVIRKPTKNLIRIFSSIRLDTHEMIAWA